LPADELNTPAKAANCGVRAVTDRDDELLGGLPRSRPGTRSSRRTGAPARAKRPPAEDAPAPTADQDPVGDAVRTVARGAEAGLKVAQAVTREVFRRLPRM
jgi:hypothetical protein